MSPKKQAGERLKAADVADLLVGPGADIEALVTLTMMEAANDARDDLRAIMAGVRAANAAKRHQRELLCKISRDVVSAVVAEAEAKELQFSPHGLGGAGAYERVEVAFADPESPGGVRFAVMSLVDGRVTSARQLEAARDAVQSKLDSMSELGEMESLRLQMAMDRLAKLMSTLSNLLKKISDTSQAVTQNLK